MSAPAKATAPAPSVVQGDKKQKCNCAAAARTGQKCAECEEKEKARGPILQRAAADAAAVGGVPPVVHDVLGSPGAPLDSASRGYFEPRFGADFSRVRVHTGPRAEESARAVHARAYTVGDQIVFGAGEYAPHTAGGRALLAHELTHTLQQGGMQKAGTGLAPDRIAGNDAAEREAGQMAAAVLSDRTAPPVQQFVAGRPVQRVTAKELLDESLPDQMVKKKKGPRVNGNAAHKAIQQDFASKNPDIAIKPFAIPTASSTPYRTEDRRDPTVIPHQYGGGRAGKGTPDLMAKAAENKVQVAEIKPATYEDAGIGLGLDQLPNYIEKGNSDEAADVRARTKYTGSPISKFELMDPGLYNQTQPLNVNGVPVSTAWYQPGLLLYGYLPGTQLPEKPPEEAVAREEYTISVAGQELTFQVAVPPAPEGKKKAREAPWAALNDDQNIAVARSIPGVTFLRVQRLPGNFDKIDVAITTQSEQDPKGLRLKIEPKVNLIHLELDKKTRKLRELKGANHIPFDFPGMSLGELKEVHYSDDKGLSGKGVIRPSIPLLRGAELQIAFAGDELRVTAPVPKDKLKSLPGLRVIEAGLNFELSPEFKPSGDIKFEIGPKQKPLGSGSVSVSADEQGFLAQGDLDARVPGFDEATAHVTYRREAGWQGVAHLKTSKSFLRNAAVTVGLSDQGMDVAGSAQIALPGEQLIDVGVSKKGDRVVLTGDGQFQVPGGKVEPVKLHVTWDGEHVTGTGSTGFKFKGFNGNLHLTYTDGRVSGTGELDFEKGKAKGKLKVKMSPEQRFSGEGELTYKLTDNLIATAGIAVDEQEKVTLKGGLEFPNPIQLFKPFQGDREIFSVGVSIPIPGASVGPVGLKARFEGSLSAGYAVGPGELRNVKLTGSLNPFEDNPQVDVQLSATLYIGASAHVSGSVSGAIMIDAGIAAVSGGIKVTATAVLDGHFQAGADIHYQQGRFELSADFEAALQLILKLALDAFVKAEAGVGPFKKETTREWALAAYTYDPGLGMKIKSKKKLVYDSARPFEPPGLDDIEVTKPSLDISALMGKVFGAGGKPEVTKE